mmetsp:Transcript_39248/g.82072  ORF Transcript_39248/g.82072 Transcript_39248/m.82072 type:complete len:89 (+) Transcript_39248:1181-1447(+)
MELGTVEENDECMAMATNGKDAHSNSGGLAARTRVMANDKGQTAGFNGNGNGNCNHGLTTAAESEAIEASMSNRFCSSTVHRRVACRS